MKNIHIELDKDSYTKGIEILRDLSKKGYWYAVGLLLLDKQRKRHEIGSGVLVQVDRMFAILTADHVANKIGNYPILAIAFGIRRDISQMLYLHIEGLVVKTIGGGKDARLGPDLALIILPPCYIVK